jgi:hypothetical protein
MKTNLICLDIDDCIFPSNQNYFGKTTDALKVLEINLKRLVMILEKYNLKLFMTSSWYHLYEIEAGCNGKLIPRDNTRKQFEYDNEIKGAHDLIVKYIEKYFIGMSSGDRSQDIINLLQDENYNKIIVMDDWNLQKECDLSDRALYIPMYGYIDGNVGFMIHKFMMEDTKVTRRSYY